MSWLLIRLSTGYLEVELDALASDGKLLGTFPTRPEAVAARDRRHADAILGLAGLAKAEAGR